MGSSWTVAVTQDSGRRTSTIARGDHGRIWDQELPPVLKSSMPCWRMRWRHHAAHRSHRWLRARPAPESAGGLELRGRLRQHRRPRSQRARCACLQHARGVDQCDRRSHLGAAARGRAPHPESIAYVRDGKWKTWGPLLLLGREVSGATIGIVGLGRDRQGGRKTRSGFDMRVLAFDPFEDAAFARERGDLRSARAASLSPTS